MTKADRPRRPRAEGMALRVVAALIGLFPASFRERYGAEMLDTFRERWRERLARGRGAAARLLAGTVVSLLGSAIREHMDGWEPRSPTHTGSRTGGGYMDRLAQDLRYALRFLRRSPGYTAIVLLTLALGIGMNTAVFSVLYGVLYRDLPYAQPSELVRVGRTHPSLPNVLLPLSPGNFLELRESAASMARIEGETGRAFVFSGEGTAASHPGNLVSAGFLDLLGVPPAMGRTFRPEDDVVGAASVVVVSDGFWRTQLGADPAIIGKEIRLNDEPHTVVGVMPPDFRFFQSALWVPFRWDDETRAVRTSNYVRMYGRLAPRATEASLTTLLRSEWAVLREQYPPGNQQTDFAVQDLATAFYGTRRAPLFILAGAAAFVLLIACANVANLMLVRAEHRQREVGVRSALGADRSRLARQFLTEGLLAAGLGGLLGIAVAYAGIRLLLSTFGTAVPRADEIGIHPAVLLFTLVASLATGILVGLAPALRSRPDFDALREGSRGGTARFTLFGRSLVVAEIALALMLVTGAGLLLKSYARATRSDLGFDSSRLAVANLWFPQSRYAEPETMGAFMAQLQDRLESTPSVQSVAMSNMVPIREFGNNVTELTVVGRAEPKASFVEMRVVTPDFFETLGLRLLNGRIPTEREALEQLPVVLINRTLARQLFGEEDPLGERLAFWDGYEPEIIGILDDIRDFGPDQRPRPTSYRPAWFSNNVLIRASGSDPGAAVGAVRTAAREIDPEVAVVRFETLDDIIDRSLAGRRFQLSLIAVFAATALILASIGIYGVLSYTVARQTREIGVRMALGARAGGVARHVAWNGGRLALAGVFFGLGGALLLRGVISSQLFEVESFDPLVYVGVSGVLLLVATAACLLPAHRAARTEPTQALRMD